LSRRKACAEELEDDAIASVPLARSSGKRTETLETVRGERGFTYPPSRKCLIRDTTLLYPWRRYIYDVFGTVFNAFLTIEGRKEEPSHSLFLPARNSWN
jgi:hypothetical protein